MITVEQDILGTISLSFKYYPDYIKRVKELGCTFEPSTKKWLLPIYRFNEFRNKFDGEVFYKTPEWEILNQPPPDYSQLYSFNTQCDINSLGFKLPPYKYQEFGIKFLIDRLEDFGMGFIADDVGLGKTCQAIGAFKYMFDNNKIKNLVIVCKKSIRSQWANEIKTFLDLDADVYIADDSKKKRDKVYEEIKNNTGNTVLIINYHLLLKDVDLINSDMTIYDECHVSKKYNGEINKACRALTKKAKYCLFMTGTPIMSNPEDMYGIISIKDQKYFGKLKEFKDRYFTMYYNGKYATLVGFKNLNELRDKMQNLILRRTANEVAIDLPDIVPIKKECSIDATQTGCLDVAQAQTKLVEDKMEAIKNKLKSNPAMEQEDKNRLFGEYKNLEGRLKGFIAIEQAIANTPVMFHYSKSKGIQQVYKDLTPSPSYLSDKMVQFIDIIETIKDGGGKVVCFTKYETVAKYCIDLLSKNKINAVMYSGGMTGNERDKAIDDFKNEDDITAIIGTDALAEGVNLQTANNVINIDLPFNVAIYNQRIGRIRRAGSSHKTGFVYNLLTDESIDVSLWNKIQETANTFDGFISVDKAQSELLKQLNN